MHGTTVEDWIRSSCEVATLTSARRTSQTLGLCSARQVRLQSMLCTPKDRASRSWTCDSIARCVHATIARTCGTTLRTNNHLERNRAAGKFLRVCHQAAFRPRNGPFSPSNSNMTWFSRGLARGSDNSSLASGILELHRRRAEELKFALVQSLICCFDSDGSCCTSLVVAMNRTSAVTTTTTKCSFQALRLRQRLPEFPALFVHEHQIPLIAVHRASNCTWKNRKRRRKRFNFLHELLFFAPKQKTAQDHCDCQQVLQQVWRKSFNYSTRNLFDFFFASLLHKNWEIYRDSKRKKRQRVSPARSTQTNLCMHFFSAIVSLRDFRSFWEANDERFFFSSLFFLCATKSDLWNVCQWHFRN